ncbi:MAG: Nif11-like leader peptide family RiPP precursor [Oscillospiraceae bacterium]|nr:Nif11-like leader peptide family RiPP precursor [Oscillospiraceae bacterium]
MNQMQAFIEKARSDKDLMARLDALGASGAEMEKVVALAAEYGFTVTEEDCRQAAARACPHKAGKLAEEDLEAVAGAFGTENRYDPAVCGQYTRVHFNCVGFLGGHWCDHYVQKTIKSGHCRYKCNMGYYEYELIGAGH